jgi:hypothetical protein
MPEALKVTMDYAHPITRRAARKKYGLLEKHKDYVQRAKNFHKKEKALQVRGYAVTVRAGVGLSTFRQKLQFGAVLFQANAAGLTG